MYCISRLAYRSESGLSYLSLMLFSFHVCADGVVPVGKCVGAGELQHVVFQDGIGGAFGRRRILVCCYAFHLCFNAGQAEDFLRELRARGVRI